MKLKQWQNIFHVIVNANSIAQYIIEIKNRIIKRANVNVKIIIKNYHTYKKDYSCNPSTCICENSKYLKSVADTLVAKCDEIVIVIDITSTNKKSVTT